MRDPSAPVVLRHAGAAGVRAAASAGATTDEAAPAEPEAPQRRLVVRFLTTDDFPPFNYNDDEGVLTGLNVDLARAICLEIGAACDIKVRPWDELFIALKRGDADAVIAAHTVGASNSGDVDFTDRYFQTPGRFAGRTDAELTDVNPGELYGKKIGVAKGTTHEAFVRAFFRDSRVEAFENIELARDALQQGRIDLVFDDAHQPVVLAQGHPVARVLRVQGRGVPGAEVLRRRACHRGRAQ